MNSAGERYPYVVVRLMAALRQREEIAVYASAPRSRVGFRDSFVHHPTPFAADGAVRQGCRNVLVAATFEAVRRTGLRQCLVWPVNESSSQERSLSTNNE